MGGSVDGWVEELGGWVLEWVEELRRIGGWVGGWVDETPTYLPSLLTR